MNFNLDKIPGRTAQPRSFGLTMVTDKGLSLQDTKDFGNMCCAKCQLHNIHMRR